MFNHTKRQLMAEVDAGGASAAPAPAETTTTPTEPQAQAAPSLTKDDLKAFAAEMRDGIFADLRKAGVFGKEAKTKTKEPEVTHAPQQPDPIKLRALDRALAKHGFADRLNDSQYRRVEKAFAEDSPDDAIGWVKDYFEGFGAAAQPAAPQASPQPQQQAAQQPKNDRPVSDRGAPPPARVPIEEADLVTMSKSDREALIREKGVRWYWDRLGQQLKGRPVSIR